ncbi:MAG TPA: VOC family protein [Streptosporangiaceae bacterium]|jgi:predicted enzyme related to lactoylglutathione lyase
MELVQARLVTDDVAALAAFYARLLDTQVTLNGYYVEVPAGPASVGFSHRRFTEYPPGRAARPACPHRREEFILDFEASDVDAEHGRITALGVDWLLPPTDQPWGNRTMTFRDPAGTLVNVFSRGQAGTG